VGGSWRQFEAISEVSQVTPVFKSSKLSLVWSHLDDVEAKCVSLQYISCFLLLSNIDYYPNGGRAYPKGSMGHDICQG
jgi:hypothetical protein